MSSWNGFEDNDNGGAELLPSPTPPSSPFRVAFRTPRPAGIQTGVRNVPPNLSMHPEDLYDTLQVEFDKVMIRDPSKRNKTRLTFEERGHMIRHLTMTETDWRGLPRSEKDIQEWNRRSKALRYFEMKGTLLMRKPEILAEGTDHEIQLPLRQVALDDDVYYVIKQAHERLGHAGYRKTFDAVRLDVYGINREECKWFVDHCRRCESNRPPHGRPPLQPIESDGINKRVQIGLIDMQAEPSGPYKWILITKDHFDEFVTLWPLQNKTAQEVADALDIFLMCCGPWETLQCDCGAEFKAAVAILMRRHGVKIIYSSPHQRESQDLVEQTKCQVKPKLRAWKAETNLENWDLALTTISLQLNHSISSSTGRKPYELRFNGRSYFTSATWTPFTRREFIRLQLEGENDEQTPGDVYVEGIEEAVAQGREFCPLAVAGAMPQALQSRRPISRSLRIAGVAETRPLSPDLSLRRQSSSLPPQDPSTPNLMQIEAEQEEDDNPEQHPTRRGANRARQHMTNKYEKSGQVIEFVAGDYCTIKVPKKDRPSGATSIRLPARVLRRCGHVYELQTKHGILRSRYGPQNLNPIDPCTADRDAAQVGSNRRKITLRYAARASYIRSSKRRIYCGCSGECRSRRCVCYRNGAGCTIHCHKRSGDCPNKATGPAYAQITVIEQVDEG